MSGCKHIAGCCCNICRGGAPCYVCVDGVPAQYRVIASGINICSCNTHFNIKAVSLNPTPNGAFLLDRVSPGLLACTWEYTAGGSGSLVAYSGPNCTGTPTSYPLNHIRVILELGVNIWWVFIIYSFIGYRSYVGAFQGLLIPFPVSGQCCFTDTASNIMFCKKYLVYAAPHNSSAIAQGGFVTVESVNG